MHLAVAVVAMLTLQYLLHSGVTEFEGEAAKHIKQATQDVARTYKYVWILVRLQCLKHFILHLQIIHNICNVGGTAGHMDDILRGSQHHEFLSFLQLEIANRRVICGRLSGLEL